MKSQLEREKIIEVTNKYIAEGYEVIDELPGYEGARGAGQLKPDLIVRKGDEVIVIEVKSAHSVRESKNSIAQLANYAKNTRGVRFDLVLTNPKPSSIQVLQAELKILREGVLSDVKDAVERNNPELSLVLSFRLIEGLFARLATSQGIYVPSGRWNLDYLLDKLTSEGIISEAVADLVQDVIRKRNAIFHGTSEERTRITKEESLAIYRKLSNLMRQWGGEIKMIEASCPVCEQTFNSYLNLARHMVLTDRPNGEHITYLQELLGKPFQEFGWRSDKKIAAALKKRFH